MVNMNKWIMTNGALLSCSTAACCALAPEVNVHSFIYPMLSSPRKTVLPFPFLLAGTTSAAAGEDL